MTAADDWWELIEEAKVLLGEPARRQDARRLLDRVLSGAPGTAAAAAALDLLERLEVMEPRLPERRDAETEALRDEWSGISTPWDARLPGFLARLRQRPAALAELLPQVAGYLCKWLDDGTRQIHAFLDGTGPEPDESRLAALERLDPAAADLPGEGELRGGLVRFREACFRLLLNTVTIEIRRACDAWETERAWELICKLDGAPAAYAAEVRRLEESIYEADALRTEVEGGLERWPRDVPDQWAGLRVVLESLAEARRILDGFRLPADRRQSVDQRAGELVATARVFLETQAAGSVTADGLKGFWQNVQRLQPARADLALEDHRGWYEPALGRLAEEVAAAAARAVGAGDLERLAQRLEADLSDMPPAVAERFADWGGRLRRIAESWRLMELGEEFTQPAELPSDSPAVLPARFVAEAIRYQEALAHLQSASAGLDRTGDLREREAACDQALEAAHRVLERMPQHRGAVRLARRAEQRRVHLRLDEALERWNVAALLESLIPNQVDAPYRELPQAAAALRELAGLAANPQLPASPEAARWWRQWRQAAAVLPQVVPEALSRACQAEEARRCKEWSLALDQLLRSDPSPEACREAAELLAEFLAVPGLQSYYEELLQREKVGKAERLIAAGHWGLAEEELRGLEARTADFRRLSCRLAVGRARAAGPVVFAEELARNWTDVVATFGPEAYEQLEAALGEVWERGEGAALRKLGEIALRVSRAADLPVDVRGRILDWLSWLQVEKALEEGTSASSLRQLVTYVRGQTFSPRLRARLRSWIERWQQRDETVALAWAFQAFPDLVQTGDGDLVEELARRSREVAGRVLLELRARTDLTRLDLVELRQQVERCERDWRDLDDYLDLAPRPVERPVPPDELKEARKVLDALLRAVEGIEHLETCDLRRPAERSSWKAVHLGLKQDLHGLPAVSGLLRRLNQLEPLTRLNHFESRLRDTAARCNDPDPQELDCPGLFAEAAGWVREIVQSFETAGLAGRDMWTALSAELWREIPPLAGDLEGPPARRDLQALARRFDALDAQERELRQILRVLGEKEPWVSANGPFQPELHPGYLALYPAERPSSRRVFRLFDRFARTGARPVILRDGAGQLPAWISDYLKRGVP